MNLSSSTREGVRECGCAGGREGAGVCAVMRVRGELKYVAVQH